MIAETCPNIKRTVPPNAGLLSISPLIDNGKYLFPYVKGWQVERLNPPKYQLNGEYFAIMGWVGEQAKNKAFQLIDCMKKSKLGNVEIEEIVVEKLSNLPAAQVFIKTKTPAQFAYRPFWGASIFLSIPTVSRLFKPALQYLYHNRTEYEEISKNLDFYTGIIEGSWKPVTVMFDRVKTNAWSIIGRIRIAVSQKAPMRVLEILGIASRILQYSGTGKSRLNGFGQVDVAIEV